jgi:hypothetical protein
MNFSSDGAAPQPQRLNPVTEKNAAYPLATPSAWMDHEKFGANFSRVSAGWQSVYAPDAAVNISKAMGSRVSAVEEMPEPGRLFVVGDIGYIGKSPSQTSENLPRTIKKIKDSLALIGELSIESTGGSLAGDFVRIRQTVKGVPIYGAHFAVHLNFDRMAYAIVGTPAPENLEIPDLTTKLTSEEAIEIVATDLGKTTEYLTCKAEEILLPVDEELRRCYLVRIIAREPLGDWRGFVGLDGKILGLFNIASGASGLGSGYKVDPLRSRSVESLKLTDLLDPPIELTGLRSEVWGQNQSRASSQNGQFIFTPDQSEFDEPQAYYFLQRCWETINSLTKGRPAEPLLNEKKFRPIRASVHVQDAANNAYYVPDNGELYFGDTTDDPPRYSSRALDIVLHEFGHAISDSMCELGRAKPHDSSRAMSEGFSDYFAATVLNDPVFGEYFAQGHSRTCANQMKFPGSFAGDEHEIGTIWAGFLWDLRQEAGQEVTDAITLQSLSYLGPWRTIRQGVDALLQADRMLFPSADLNTGRHEDLIHATFKNRRR